MIFDPTNKRIFVAGHRGMVGSAVVRRLKSENCEILTADRKTLDLRDQGATSEWMLENRPDAVIMAAARVGGIIANNTYPVDFLQENLSIQNSVFAAAHAANVNRLLFLGSSCIYPKLAEQPIKEEALLTGPLEPTNEAYAIAKIAGIYSVRAYRRQYGRDWISAMPTNLYGPGDNYHPENSHVLPALLRKFHEANEKGSGAVEIWGSGTPLREFMHSDDLADALVFLLKNYSSDDHINVGSGEEVSIRELAQIIARESGYIGSLTFDASKPDGTPRKLMDSRKIFDLGWKPKVSLEDGIQKTYREEFLNSNDTNAD
ncbi:GDP-L-fucose synthase family protein [Roseobacter sp. HKCC-CH-9208]|uniref:GDP-L-fucose synthase family protein n=1 Tax=Roseobacter sp. HKCC-CH-9208 TaxID=3120339 RepID=UPI0030ED1725